MKTKGQAFMSDFAVSMALFGVLLSAFFIPWNTMVESDQRFSESDRMKTQAERTAALMITTSGYPSDWEENDSIPDIPGFSEEQDNVISVEKLEAFNSIDYEDKRSLLNVQDFSLEFVDSDTGEVLEYDGSESESSNYLGREPVAYIASDTSFSNLEMLDDLNSSDREWYFYFPSDSNQDQLDSLTAEEVYTDTGENTGEMFEKMITDAADKGWSLFNPEESISASQISFIADIDGDEGLEMYYQGSNDRLNLFNIDEGSTETLNIGTSFQRLGEVENFTAEEGLELSYIDQNSNLAFYNYNTGNVETTPASALDVGGSTEINGSQTVFFSDNNNNLGYYSSKDGENLTSNNAGMIGGTGDIDSDGNTELAYQDGDDNLAFYDAQTGEVESTGFQVSDVGGISEGLVAVQSGSNDYLGLWNYSDSSFETNNLNIGSVGSLIQLNEDAGLDAVAFDSNNRLGYYDFSLALNYNTVIAEGIGQETDNSGILRSAVENGLTYLQSGPSSGSVLTQTFGMNYQAPGSQEASIQSISPLLNGNFTEGDVLTFQSSGGFTNIDTAFATSTGSPDSCMACMQSFGGGKVYYLADATAGDDQTAFTRPDSVIKSSMESSNVFDQGASISEGAETVVTVDRKVIVNKSRGFENAEMNYVVWR